MLSPLEKKLFPNICRYLRAHATSCQEQTRSDVIRFFSDQPPRLKKGLIGRRGLATEATTRPRHGTAEFLVIEAINPDVVKYVLKILGKAYRTSFLAMLEDFVDSNPSYNFDDLQNHLQSRRSAHAYQQHVCFHVMGLREFNKSPNLDREGLLDEIEARRQTWKDPRLHGLLMPAERKERGKRKQFPPCVLSRNHFAAWFGKNAGQGWQTGIILVDSLLDLDRPGAVLKPPAYGKLARSDISLVPPDTRSYRTALSHLITHNRSLMSRGVPSPFVALQELYRIIASEWIVLNTYIVRDINNIGWSLLGPDSSLRSEGQFGGTLDVLFSSLWRLDWILQLAAEPLRSCRERGHPNWDALAQTRDPAALLGPDISGVARVQTALVQDFEQVLAQLSLTSKRVEQSISHVMALTRVVHTKLGLEETGRAIIQNKVLMALSLVAVFFLPASVVAAIVSMPGNWSPGQPGFGVYCAIVASLSIALLISVASMWFWTSISSSIDRLHAPRKRWASEEDVLAGSVSTLSA